MKDHKQLIHQYAKTISQHAFIDKLGNVKLFHYDSQHLHCFVMSENLGIPRILKRDLNGYSWKQSVKTFVKHCYGSSRPGLISIKYTKAMREKKKEIIDKLNKKAAA